MSLIVNADRGLVQVQNHVLIYINLGPIREPPSHPLPMLNISNRTAASAARAAHRVAPSKGMATVSSRIGDKNVSMSLHEPDSYINYQRIEDNLAIVRERCALQVFGPDAFSHGGIQVEATANALRKDCIWSP